MSTQDNGKRNGRSGGRSNGSERQSKPRPGMHSSTLHGDQKTAPESPQKKPNDGKTNHSGRPKSKRNGGKKGAPKVSNKGDHILFVGFMGSGKSSVCRVLAKRTGLPLIDVDKRIEQEQGRKISEIFAEEGEQGFRRIETQTMAALAYEPKSIVSCGGGIIGSAVNRGIVKALGTVVYLKVPCDEAVGRISNPATRPMLNGERPVQEIYDERLPLYQDVADITINTSGKSVGQNVGQVIGALRKRGLI